MKKKTTRDGNIARPSLRRTTRSTARSSVTTSTVCSTEQRDLFKTDSEFPIVTEIPDSPQCVERDKDLNTEVESCVIKSPPTQDDSSVVHDLKTDVLITPKSGKSLSFLERVTPYKDDVFQSSQHDPSCDVVWDCTSPDALSYLRSRRRKRHTSDVSEIAQKLSADTKFEDQENESENGKSLLGLWMKSKVSQADTLTNSEQQGCYPFTRSRKKERKTGKQLSAAALIEKLQNAMRLRDEETPPKSEIKRHRDCSKLNSSKDLFEHSKLNQRLKDNEKVQQVNDSDASWSEDDFFEDDSLIIKATQNSEEFLSKPVTSKRKSPDVDTSEEPPAKLVKYIDQKKEVDKTSVLKKPPLPPGKSVNSSKVSLSQTSASHHSSSKYKNVQVRSVNIKQPSPFRKHRSFEDDKCGSQSYRPVHLHYATGPNKNNNRHHIPTTKGVTRSVFNNPSSAKSVPCSSKNYVPQNSHIKSVPQVVKSKASIVPCLDKRNGQEFTPFQSSSSCATNQFTNKNFADKNIGFSPATNSSGTKSVSVICSTTKLVPTSRTDNTRTSSVTSVPTKVPQSFNVNRKTFALGDSEIMSPPSKLNEKTTAVITPGKSLSSSTRRRSSGMFNSSLTDDLLCQIAEKDDILDSQVMTSTTVKTDEQVRAIDPSFNDEKVKSEVKVEVKSESADTGSKISTLSNDSNRVPVIKCELPTMTQINLKKMTEKEKEDLNLHTKIKRKDNVDKSNRGVLLDSEELFGSDDDDELNEPQILAFLDSVELQATQSMKRDTNKDFTVQVSSEKQHLGYFDSDSLPNSQSSNSTSPFKCTPEEIEQKRKLAIAKRCQKSFSNEKSNNVTGNSSSPGSNSTSPFKCSPSEIEKKRVAALAKRRQKSGNNLNGEVNKIPLKLSENEIERSCSGIVRSPCSKSKSPIQCSPSEIEQKRQAALCMRQQRMGTNLFSSQIETLVSPVKSIQDEIERKKQAALKRREEKQKATRNLNFSSSNSKFKR